MSPARLEASVYAASMASTARPKLTGVGAMLVPFLLKMVKPQLEPRLTESKADAEAKKVSTVAYLIFMVDAVGWWEEECETIRYGKEKSTRQ